MNAPILIKKSGFYKYLLELYYNSEYYKKKHWRKLSEESLHSLYKYYSLTSLTSNESKDKECIIMFDGKLKHGGICDRIWGIVSSYIFCDKNKIRYKIFFYSPFDISLFLMPNHYDWRIALNDIKYDLQTSSPVVLWTYFNLNEKKRFSRDDLSILKKISTRQIHLYTNAHAYFDEFSSTFNYLFKPSEILENAINDNIKAINNKYISVSFRFQNTMGDFSDFNSSPITDSGKSILIKKCKIAIEKIKYKHPTHTLLVTSDSKRILNEIAGEDRIYIIPGNICHLDYGNSRSDIQTHLKTFLDLFMISKADKVYLVYGKHLYLSTFAKTASMIGNKPFEIYNIN